MPHKELNSNDLAYMAGMVDADGWIGIRKNGQDRFLSAIQVAQTKMTVLDWIQDSFGGNVYTEVRKPPARNIYRWKVHSKIAVGVLKQILPFLKLKREQAVLVLSLQDRINDNLSKNGYKPLSNEEISKRMEYVIRAKELNRKGVIYAS